MDDKKLDEKVIGEGDKPTPTPHEKAGLKAPTWLSRPIVHDDHVRDLEHDAAINEFGHKMARPDAEEHAYQSYLKKQRTEAAIHHLKGIKAAAAAGDMEAARKHNLMYDIHSKA